MVLAGAGGGGGPSMHLRSWFSMAAHPAALYPAEAQQAIQNQHTISVPPLLASHRGRTEDARHDGDARVLGLALGAVDAEDLERRQPDGLVPSGHDGREVCGCEGGLLEGDAVDRDGFDPSMPVRDVWRFGEVTCTSFGRQESHVGPAARTLPFCAQGGLQQAATRDIYQNRILLWYRAPGIKQCQCHSRGMEFMCLRIVRLRKKL